MSNEMILRGAVEWLLCKPTRDRTYAMFLDIVAHQAKHWDGRTISDDESLQAYLRIPSWNRPVPAVVA